jgi:hypothetical protein
MTAADRQRVRRERQRALGRLPVQVWLDKDAIALLDDLCTELGDERAIVIEKALNALQRTLQPQTIHAQRHQRRRQAFKTAG